MSRWQIKRHREVKKKGKDRKASPPSVTVQHESPLPPKWRHISHSQADASSSSSGHPQSHAHLFEFNPSLLFLDPQAALPGNARTESSDHFVDDVLLNLHAWAHRTTNKSDNEDSEDALEGDAVEAANSIDDDFWNGEDVGMEGDVDPREGIVSDWDILAEEFIVEAEGLSKFEHSLFHTP